MIERKLTPEQIDNLFELCEFHNVNYYDVQIELVDHIASSIEALWETNLELSFEEASFLVGEQFGIDPGFNVAHNSLLPPISGKTYIGESGFEAIKEAKEKELRKKYDRLQWKYIGEFFKLPKIILTLAITFALFFVFKLSNNDIVVSYCIQGFYILFLAIYLIFIYPKKFRLSIITGKSFLLYEQFRNIKRGAIGTGLSFFNILALLRLNPPFSNNFNWQLFVSFFITLSGITVAAICIDTPKRIKEDFTREFPQFVKS
jgi:hypothetical protein